MRGNNGFLTLGQSVLLCLGVKGVEIYIIYYAKFYC